MSATLQLNPPYPGAKTSRADGIAYLLWRLNLGKSAALNVKPDGQVDYLRAMILNDHGETRIMGRGPTGKNETLRELFDRVTGQELIPRKKIRRA